MLQSKQMGFSKRSFGQDLLKLTSNIPLNKATFLSHWLLVGKKQFPSMDSNNDPTLLESLQITNTLARVLY